MDLKVHEAREIPGGDGPSKADDDKQSSGLFGSFQCAGPQPTFTRPHETDSNEATQATVSIGRAL